MRSLVIVERNVAPDCMSVGPEIFPKAPQTFLLDRSVESFEMAVVVGSSDSAEAMHSRLLPEEFLELRPVIALQHLERKGRRSLRLFQEGEAAARIDAL